MENMKKTSGDNLKHSDKSQGSGDTGKKPIDITRDKLEILMKRDEIDKIEKEYPKLKKYTSKILKDLKQFSEAFLDPSKEKTKKIYEVLNSAFTDMIPVINEFDILREDMRKDTRDVDWEQNLNNARYCETTTNNFFKALKDQVISFFGEGLEKYRKAVQEIDEKYPNDSKAKSAIEEADSRIVRICESAQKNLKRLDTLKNTQDRLTVFAVLYDLKDCLESLHKFQDGGAVSIVNEEQKRKSVEITNEKDSSIKRQKLDNQTYTGDSSSGSPFKDNWPGNNLKQLTGKSSLLQILSSAQSGYEKVLKNNSETLEAPVKDAMESIKNEILNLDKNLYSKYKGLNEIITSNNSNTIKELTIESLKKIKNNIDFIKSKVPENSTYRERLKEFEGFLSKGLNYPIDNTGSTQTSEFQQRPKTQSPPYESYHFESTPYAYGQKSTETGPYVYGYWPSETGAYPYMQQPSETGANNSQFAQNYFTNTRADEFGQSLDSGQSSTQQQRLSEQYESQQSPSDAESFFPRNKDLGPDQKKYIVAKLKEEASIEKIKHARSLANSDAAREYSSHANSQSVSALIRDDCNRLILNYELENPSSSTRSSDTTKRKKQLQSLSNKEALDDEDYLEIFNQLLENSKHPSMSFSYGIQQFSQWLQEIKDRSTN